jgi:hypothetical protein
MNSSLKKSENLDGITGELEEQQNIYKWKNDSSYVVVVILLPSSHKLLKGQKVGQASMRESFCRQACGNPFVGKHAGILL